MAHVALIGVTGVLVRAETSRPDLPKGVNSFTDIVYRRSGDRRARLDIYVPSSRPPVGGRPVILAIHGGGWSGGSKDLYGRDIARLAQYGYVVASVDYLLARPGEPSWPENFEDVREAARWLRRRGADYGIDSNRMVAMGASAGGHLAALLGTHSEEERNADPVSARVQAVVNFYGPTDLLDILKDTRGAAGPISLLLGGDPTRIAARYEAASPARHVSPDDPPMLLIHGRADRLIPVDQSTHLASALGRVGIFHREILLDGEGHGFGLEVTRDLIPEILDFLASVWKDNQETR